MNVNLISYDNILNINTTLISSFMTRLRTVQNDLNVFWLIFFLEAHQTNIVVILLSFIVTDNVKINWYLQITRPPDNCRY